MFKTRKEYLDSQKPIKVIGNAFDLAGAILTDYFVPIALGVAVAAVIAGIVVVSKESEQKREAFYKSCLEEQKMYQCDVMWSQISTNDSAIMLGAAAVGIAAGSVGVKR